MEHAWIREIARTISADRPVMFLADLARRPRATAKSWYTGHRRAPLSVLGRLRNEAESRKYYDLVQQFEYLIRRRSYEPPRRTGFWIIDPVTGQNSANRRGRPRTPRDMSLKT
jgi:hypothetical protein